MNESNFFVLVHKYLWSHYRLLLKFLKLNKRKSMITFKTCNILKKKEKIEFINARISVQ